jgi:hypothetical protein
MSATSQIALPEALLQQAASQANHLGVSTERWIELAVAERLRLENADAEYFRTRAARASGRSLGEILDKGGDNPPDPGDEF